MRLLLITCLATSATLASAAEITLREDAAAGASALVRLGDIADVTGRDADRVASLPLMPAPAAGTKQSLTTTAIRAMLSAQGESVASHRFRGAFTVRVAGPERSRSTDDSEWRTPLADQDRGVSTAFRKRGRITREPVTLTKRGSRRLAVATSRAVDQAVTAAVQEAIDQRLGSLAAEKRLLVRDVELTATARRELQTLASQPLIAKVPEGTTLVPGKLTADLWPESRLGEDSFRVVADVVEQRMRVVVKEPLSRGTMIVASAVRLEAVPLDQIDRPGALGYTSVDEVIGKEASRTLRAGDVLSEGNTAPPMMVRRGEQVFVVSGGGGITVTLQALAKQDGRKGELIAVEMLDRRDELMARVVGYGKLAVLSAGPELASAIRTGDLR
ncbi:MAG: flagellar basal body P-ring formation chaperone FlgA [Planctomycetota bacterium]